MPGTSFRWSQFLCCCCWWRRSPKPSHENPSVVSSPGLDPSHTLSSRPSSGSSEDDVDAATSTSHLLVPGNPSHQNLTSRFPLNRAPVDFGGRPSPASRPVTPTIPIISSHDSVVQLDIQLAPPSDDTHSAQAQQDLAPSPSPDVLTTPSQQSFRSETSIPPVGRVSPQLRQQKGMFDHAHNFSMTQSTFVDGNIYNIDTISSQFMKGLLEKTIPGATSDSSARYPPPQCHPGTRLEILERCLHFIANCDGKRRICWVVGFAGVGKSAIMQSVADSPKLLVTCHVSLFFSIYRRDDGTKAIITLCYQLAAKSEPYRHLIEREVARDPSLLQSSMPVQFQKFIIEPFICHPQLRSAGRILIIIDGLDECNNPCMQQDLLRLISDFCITYPSSPLVWLIASRPEQHITSFFAREDVMPAYEKEEIQVDSGEGCADVEKFLREKLEEIKRGSISFDPHSKWPEEEDLWKLAKAAGGLFAYAGTVIKYIGDLNVGSPVSQLSDVLKVIDNHPMTGIPRERHPMALLDALYARILSNVPAKVIIHTQKLVLALASSWSKALTGRGTFVVLCNWLAMTPDEAYAAVNQLQSLLRTPKRDQAHLQSLEPFHKSFIDYVSDSRSNFLPDMHHKAKQLKTECAFRVLNEAPDGVDFPDGNRKFLYGTLRRGLGTGDKVSLTWPVGENMRLEVYQLAVGEVVQGLKKRDPKFMSVLCIRPLITQFEKYRFNHDILREPIFDESRHHEFTRCGIFKQMSLKAFHGIPKLPMHISLRFRCPARAVGSLSDPWNSSCQHVREGKWETGKAQDWKTNFSPYGCDFCRERFVNQLKSCKTHFPDRTVPVLFTSTGWSCVELQLVDPDDDISKWTYWFWVDCILKERIEYKSTV